MLANPVENRYSSRGNFLSTQSLLRLTQLVEEDRPLREVCLNLKSELECFPIAMGIIRAKRFCHDRQ
jgi:hypothetical protein